MKTNKDLYYMIYVTAADLYGDSKFVHKFKYDDDSFLYDIESMLYEIAFDMVK